MGKDKNIQTGSTSQLRASAEMNGKNGDKGFSSVSPVQKKDAAIQRAEDENLTSNSSPAQFAGGLEEELK